MPEAWNLKIDDKRDNDTLTTFIIFCEDGVDEPIYFREFMIGASNIKINTIENQRSGRLNLNSTLEYCINNQLIEYTNGGIKIKCDSNQNIWCVYDRDLESTNLLNIRQIDDIGFTTAIQTAQTAGLNIAWSNDAFELWILLHFETVPVGNRIHRQYIYSRLTEILRELSPEIPELEPLISHPRFDYKITMKKRQNFIKFILPLLRERRSHAIANALTLEAQYNQNTPLHAWNPYTKVHHLVQHLLAYQTN